MEKEPESIATVQMKQEYAASEVYSTTSEPPPAYKRQSTSVQIAKIAAFTIVLSSFIIGSFILAAVYLQARSSCDQMHALDSVLEKEILLENLQQSYKDTPQAESLVAKNDINDGRVSSENEVYDEKDTQSEDKSVSDTDSSFGEGEGSMQMNIPLEFDLSDLAASLLENNLKSRMNCVVERKHSTEVVDTPNKTGRSPLGVNLTTDQKQKRVSGQLISIFCEGDSENDKKKENEAQQEQPIFVPLQRIPMLFNSQPQTTLSRNELKTPFDLWRNIVLRQHDTSLPGVSNNPSNNLEPQISIQVQRVPLRQVSEEAGSRGFPLPFLNHDSISNMNIQHIPLGVALQRVGITADDLTNIQKMAEEKIAEEFRHFTEESSLIDENDSSSEEDTSNSRQIDAYPKPPAQRLTPPMAKPQFLQADRRAFGRSLQTPIEIPVPMLQSIDSRYPSHHAELERPHYVQQRSVRSVDNVFRKEKRVKRCACNCDC